MESGSDDERKHKMDRYRREGAECEDWGTNGMSLEIGQEMELLRVQ